jgi:hypothetical protein
MDSGASKKRESLNLGFFSNPRQEDEGTFSDYHTGGAKQELTSNQSSGCVPESDSSS